MISRSLVFAFLLNVSALAPASACTLTDIPCADFDGDLPPPAVLEAFNVGWKSEASSLANARYVSLFNAAAHSGDKRLYLIDLERRSVERYHVAHGRGSDPDHDGYATDFSDVPQSKKTPLGFFITAETYTGRHGHSLRLDGLEARNRNARSRAIVIHGADYVSPALEKMGRSWGCPALDNGVSRDVIERIKGGSLLYIYAVP